MSSQADRKAVDALAYPDSFFYRAQLEYRIPITRFGPAARQWDNVGYLHILVIWPSG